MDSLLTRVLYTIEPDAGQKIIFDSINGVDVRDVSSFSLRLSHNEKDWISEGSKRYAFVPAIGRRGAGSEAVADSPRRQVPARVL